MEQSKPSNQELLEIGIAKEQYPPFLYKYASVKSACRFLADHKCYFSSFDQFNDPYEGLYIIQNDYTKTDWENHFRNSVGMSPSNAQRAATDILRNPRRAAESLKKDIQATLDGSGIYCLSSENDNILLWSYYTQNHKGICVEFSLREDADFFMKHYLLPVKYDDKFPKIDFFRDAGSVVRAICHKAKCWEHEKEYRLIVPDHTRFVDEINPKAIISLILGCKNGQCETKKEFDAFDELVKLFKQDCYSHVNLMQEVLDNETYKIHIIEAPIIARIYNQELKITALKNVKVYISGIGERSVSRWKELTFKMPKGDFIIRCGDEFNKYMISEPQTDN